MHIKFYSSLSASLSMMDARCQRLIRKMIYGNFAYTRTTQCGVTVN